MHSTGRTPWDVLGLPEGAPFRDVKTAFQRKVKRAHPDVEGGSAEAFRELLAAYETLSQTAGAEDRDAARPHPAPAASPAGSTHATTGTAATHAAAEAATSQADPPPTAAARPRRATRYDAWIADEPQVRRWDEPGDTGWADATGFGSPRPADFTAVLRDEIARSTPATEQRRRPPARPLVVRPAAGPDSGAGATRGLSAFLRRRPRRAA